MKLKQYVYLMRLHKPVGIFLLLWPTLWALWLAGAGKPDLAIVVIFVIGVVLMRSAGCVINDFADRHVDKYVARTKERPLTSGKVSAQEALILFIVLIAAAFVLVLFLNVMTIALAFVGAALVVIYPFLKRVTHLPQVGLGLAFAWGVPMAFSALNTAMTLPGFCLFAAAVIWPMMYDTLYAMVDREDDIKVGIKSTAILFGSKDRYMIALLQLLFLMLIVSTGHQFALKMPFFIAVSGTAILFIYQQWLIRDRAPDQCFKAFLLNNWAGLFIFLGILSA